MRYRTPAYDFSYLTFSKESCHLSRQMPTSPNQPTRRMHTPPPATSLKYLFLTFLKVGATSFGGFVALVSVLQDQLVEKDKKLDASVILEGVSLASVLPGPLLLT